MANNLRKFATEAEYSAATLSYPAVSWVTSGDTLHYDLSGSTPELLDMVILATNGEISGTYEFVVYNCGATSVDYEFSNITLDNSEVSIDDCTSQDSLDASQVHIAKYWLNTERTPQVIGEWCSGELGFYGATVDVFIPSQVSIIYDVPDNLNAFVVAATTPPNMQYSFSGWQGAKIYVPDSAINDYKSDSTWSQVSELIYPISEYNGNLPIN